MKTFILMSYFYVPKFLLSHCYVYFRWSSFTSSFSLSSSSSSSFSPYPSSSSSSILLFRFENNYLVKQKLLLIKVTYVPVKNIFYYVSELVRHLKSYKMLQ
ncbi:unnamed protein product [Schistosoma spindalis]|nr:unnamed protein product [Schistosoma spindale]